MKNVRYTRQELTLLITCFAAYTAAYISRTNLSPALDSIQSYFHLTAAQVGWLPTVFALPYAAGQIVTGSFADRFPPNRFLAAGLFGSAAMNLLFSLSGSFGFLVGIWLLNGVFQSMIWTPIVRILASQFRDEVRDRAIFAISLTLIVGYLCAWGLSGLLTAHAGWRYAFRTSACITALMGAGCWFVLRGTQAYAAEQKTDAGQPYPISSLFLRTNLILLLVCCLCNGYVRDGIMNWAAKVLIDTQGIDLSSAVGVILIIPAVNFIGIRFGERVYHGCQSNCYTAVQILQLLSVACTAVLTLWYSRSLWLCTAMLALSSALAYGLNPLLTSVLPMYFQHTRRIALVAGLIDAMIYFGSAFSGVFTGFLSDRFGWGLVFASWTIFSLVGWISMQIAARWQKH